MIEDYMWNHNWIDSYLLSTIPLLRFSKPTLFKLMIDGLSQDIKGPCTLSGIDKQGNEIRCEYRVGTTENKPSGIMQYVLPTFESFNWR